MDTLLSMRVFQTVVDQQSFTGAAQQLDLSKAMVSPRGEIKLSAPLWIANTQFMGLLHIFQQQHPEVTFDIDISGRFVDIVEEGFDLALRASRNLNPSLIARRLTTMPFRVVAGAQQQQRVHPVSGRKAGHGGWCLTRGLGAGRLGLKAAHRTTTQLPCTATTFICGLHQSALPQP